MIKRINKNNLFCFISFSIILGLFFLTVQNGFFWDTIQLGSLHANYYYDTNFSALLLPNNIDSGHIPFFGMYLAFLWKIFGRTLIISHLAVLPFVLGIIFQMKRLSEHFIDRKYAAFACFLILIDPTLLSQITLVSPDILLVFFFLLSLNSVINNRRILLVVGIFFLFLTSMRGMMTAFIILITDVYYNINFKQSLKKTLYSLTKRGILYLPALILFLLFSYFHYKAKGWIGYHEDSPWAYSFKTVGLKGFFVNVGILAWRILDFGRIGIWLVFIILFVKYRKLVFKDRQTQSLFFIFLGFLIILPLNMLWAKNLLGHRYLLPVYLLFSLFVAKILFSGYTSRFQKQILSFIWLILIITGNFWIYPKKISQGWDSSLAHLPYYKLRKQAVKYLDSKNINIKNVASFFPNTASTDAIELNGDKRTFKKYEAGSKYVLYSNIYNINDTVYDNLKNKYFLMKEFKKNRIFIKIYLIK